MVTVANPAFLIAQFKPGLSDRCSGVIFGGLTTGLTQSPARWAFYSAYSSPLNALRGEIIPYLEVKIKPNDLTMDEHR